MRHTTHAMKSPDGILCLESSDRVKLISCCLVCMNTICVEIRRHRRIGIGDAADGEWILQ